jgi:hypothetical protein
MASVKVRLKSRQKRHFFDLDGPIIIRDVPRQRPLPPHVQAFHDRMDKKAQENFRRNQAARTACANPYYGDY